MTESTERVRQWRQQLKEGGKAALTVYVAQAEKLRLEDLAATWHCSVSDLVQQAITAYHPGSPASPGQTVNPELIRELIREELRTFRETPTPEALVTETHSNVSVTDVSQQASAKETLIPQIRDWQRGGMTLRAIADKLNAESVPTWTGKGKWYESNLSRALAKASA